jgi:glutamate/tyrosine decarboxylase-like PLP-dependent enzyme
MYEAPLRRAFEVAEAWLASQATRPVGIPVAPGELRARLAVKLAETGVDPAMVITELATALEPGLVATPGPRYFGFVTGGSLPAALAADWLVSAFDQNAAMYVTSPAAAVAEEVAAGWLLDLLDLPAESGVGFVTGAQMANFSCLAAARHALLAAEGWDVGASGLYGAPELTVIIGEQAHATIIQALRLLGLGTARRVPADDQGRMIAGDLRETLAATSGPVLVCAQAGEVNTGAFDPLREVAAAVGERGQAWLHVDGAFGLWAAASPALHPLVDGADLADSWAVDAHKWLNVPYDSGVAIVRDPAALTAALSLSAAYLPEAGEARDPLAFTPEASRRARALPVYAALRSLGRHGVADLVDRCCGLARLAAELARRPSLEILNEVVLNQVLLRVHGADTAAVIERVQRDGTCWLGGTSWRGAPAIRFSVSNWSTTEDDIRRSVAALVRAVDAVRD